MDNGSPPESRPTSCSRVRSPNAAKTGTASFRSNLSRSADIFFDVLELCRPPAIVVAVHPSPSCQRDLFKPGLNHLQQSPTHDLFQVKLHQRSGLLRVVHIRVGLSRMPPP